MSSTSLLPALEDQERDEYPFPIVDPIEPPSPPSDSTPSAPLPRTSHSRPQKSNTTSSRHRRSDRDRDRERERDPLGTSARLLSRIASRDERDAKHTRTLLVLTTERLENETRRADQAEQRVIDALHRLRAANEATVLARAETAKANESLGLYKLQLDHAQREITRAQDIVNQLERERAEAEAEAARARSTARQLREERLVERAREEGRKEGYQEGYTRGKNMGYFEARTSSRREEKSRMTLSPIDTISEDRGRESMDARSRSSPSWSLRRDSSSRTYGVAPPPVLSPLNYSDGPRSPDQISVRPPPELEPEPEPEPEPPEPEPITYVPPRSQPTPSPLPVPSPVHLQPEPDIVPIPIHNPFPSPAHPQISRPPDNWIPYQDGSNDMGIPPPHEFHRSVSPHTPSPPPRPDPTLLPRSNTPPDGYPPSVRSRDFAYSDRGGPPMTIPSGPPRSGTPQSRPSTRISQYDIVGPPRGSVPAPRAEKPPIMLPPPPQPVLPSSQFSTGTPSSSLTKVERTVTPQRTPKDERRAPSPRYTYDKPSSSSSSSTSTDRRSKRSDNRSTLEKLFKKRYKERTSPPSSTAKPVPDITVESPSTQSETQSTSDKATYPDLLSPEHANRPLDMVDPDPVVVMPYGAPPTNMGYTQSTNPVPALPNTLPMDNLPAGFMPTSYGAPPAPYGAPSTSYGGQPPVIPSPSLLVGSQHLLPQPPRTGSPYALAPIPTNVVYPDPPGKSPIPGEAGIRLSSSSGSTSSAGRRGKLSPLSLGQPFNSFANSDG